MKWSIGITTAPRDVPTLASTQLSLAKAGFDPTDTLLFSEPGVGRGEPLPCMAFVTNLERRGAWFNFLHAASFMFHGWADSTHYLICQDDVHYARNLRPWLESQLPNLSDGVVSLYCQSTNQADADGWHNLPRWQRGYGALAYVFSREMLSRFLAAPPDSNARPAHEAAQVDLKVSRWCFDAGVPLWLHTPSLCRHTGATSTLYKGVTTITPNRQCGRFAMDAEELWLRDKSTR